MPPYPWKHPIRLCRVQTAFGQVLFCRPPYQLFRYKKGIAENSLHFLACWKGRSRSSSIASMDNSSISGVVLFALGMMLLFYLLHIHISRPRSVYGPKRYPIVGFLIAFWKNQHRLLEWFTDMLRESPTQTIMVERLGGITTVLTANPANVEHILRNRFENYPKGEPFTAILHDLLGNGIFNTDGEAWKLQRKVASHEFNNRSLRTIIVKAIEAEVTERLLPLLRRCSRDDSCLDMQDVLKRFAFDNICKIAFGMDPRCLDPSFPDCEFGQALDLATQLSFQRSTAPFSLLWRAKRMLHVGSEKRLSQTIQALNGLAMEIIRHRRRETADGASAREDLMSRFMAATAFENLSSQCRGSSEEFLIDVMKSFILAGRDTTAAALTWFFWLLSSHPRIEEEIHREIVKVSAAGESKRRTDQTATLQENNGVGPFSYEELQEMHYLHASICESMRLYPPVTADSKHALQDDVLPDGTFVRRGTRVTYHPYAMGRMESIWGSNCLEFNPERWLDAKGRFVRESPFKFAVFQGGMRVCLGREMAFTQMKYIAASVIREFRLLPLNSRSKAQLVPGMTSCMLGGLPVIVNARRNPVPTTPVEASLSSSS